MSMLNRAVIATDPDRHDWHASAARVLANALLALLAYELAAVVVEMTRMIVAGPPAAPLVAALLMPVFLLVRWVFVLPGLLPVLVAIEYVSRHAPQARVLTAIVAFTPMVWWQMTQSSGDTSAHAAVLAGTCQPG